MALLKFLRGTQAGLSTQTIVDGALYFTTDSHKIFMGTASGLQEYSAIEVVSAVNTLPAVADAIKGKFYYAEAENVFCFVREGAWQQVNPDTGATSIEVVGAGNAVTAASYDATTRKITLTKGETFATKAALDELDGAVDTLTEYVGTIPENYTETNVIAYINKKAQETLDAASGGSSESAASVLAALNTYKAENDPKVQKNKEDIAALQDSVSELSDTHTADKAELEGKITAAHTAGTNAQAAVDALAGKVGTVPADTTVVDMIAAAQEAATYDDEEVRGLISDNTAAIEAIEEDYLKAADKTELSNAIALKADKSVVDGIVADYLTSADKTELEGKITAEATARDNADKAQVARIEALEGTIVGLSGAMHFEGVKDAMPEGEALAGYENGDVIIVGNKEYVMNNGAFVEFGDVSAQAEAITELTGRMDTAEGKITTLEGEMDGVQAAVATKAEAQALADAIEALEGADADQVERIAALEGKFTGDGSVEKLIAAAKSEAIAEAASKDSALETSLKEHIAAEDKKITDRVGVLETASETHAIKSEVETALAGKVDKVEGKSLVLDTEITKLAGVSEGANKVEASTTNGKIKIDGVETTVYTHPEKHAIAEVNGLTEALATKLEASDIANKADKATTLSGYGITDAMTKAEIEAMFAWGEF